MDKNKAMKLALDALLIWEEMHPKTTASAIRSPAIQALQKALEQEPWDTTDMAYRPGGLSMNLVDDQIKDLLTRIHHCMTHGYYFQNGIS